MTPRDLLGRVTLNPGGAYRSDRNAANPDSDVYLCRIGSGWRRFPLLGWGKPTPVNPLRWRNKDLANVMVSIAGILANLLIAIVAFTIFKVLLHDMRLLSHGFTSTQEPVALFLDLHA